MAQPRKLFSIVYDLALTSTDSIYKRHPQTITIVGAAGVDLRNIVERVTGNARSVPAYALAAASELLPGAVSNAAGGYTSTQTTTHNTIDLSGTTDKMIAEIGVVGNLSSGATPAYITGRIDVCINQNNQMLGQRNFEVIGQQDTSNPNFYVFPRRVYASAADKVRTGILYDNVKDLEVRLYARGVNNPVNPGSWTALGAGWTALTDGADTICIGDLALSGITPSSYHELDVAIAVRMKSGGTNPSGRFRVFAGVSYT